MRRAVGDLDVFTFKAGLLSAAAHDLHLRLAGFEVSLAGEAVTADLPLERLHVIGPVEHERTLPERYDAARKAEVDSAMRDEILHVRAHPTARFQGRAVARDGGWDVTGELELTGARASLAFAVTRGDLYRAGFELQPSRWGIAPYRALMGAIRLQDRVRVELTLREV